MNVVDAPQLRPFVCADGTQTAPIVDTLIQTGAPGRLYLSRRMVRDAARALGDFVETVEHEMALERIAELEAWKAEAEGELAELRPVRDAIAAATLQFEPSAA